jgi:hypothetical protein
MMEQTPVENESLDPVEPKVEDKEELVDQAPKMTEFVDPESAEVLLPAEAETPDGKRFTIQINSKKEDFLDALKHINKINWMTWATMGMFVIIMAVVLLMSLTGGAQQTSFNMLWSVGLILVALFMLVNGLYINPQRLATKLASEPSLSESSTLVIDERGMLDSRSASGKPIPWTIFKDMFETDRSYLLMSAANRGAYQVLPKHSFTSHQDAENFRAFALTKLPKASLRRMTLQIFPLIMFLLSVGMLVWILITRMQ